MTIKVLVMVFIFAVSNTELSAEDEEESIFSLSPPAKITLHHAIKTLEEAVNDEKIVREFCQKQFDQKRICSIKNDKETESFTKTDFRPSNCADLYAIGIKDSGVYTIYLKPGFTSQTYLKVYCDMKTEGGGWTVFQRRGLYAENKFRVNFNRGWQEYNDGFGNLLHEFWLGNENIRRLTNQDKVTLRVDMKDFEENFRYAEYSAFELGFNDYELSVAGFIGNAGDSLAYHNGQRFATYDKDTNNCAKNVNSGWWFKNCLYWNLNGEYLEEKHNKSACGIYWSYWRGGNYSLEWTEMKIRPTNFISTDPF